MKIFDAFGEVALSHKGMLCSLGGGSKSDNVTSTTAPWSGQQGHLTNVFDNAKGLYSSAPLSFFPGKTYAGFSPQTEQALGSIEQRATAGSPLQAAGNAAMRATASGEMLNANPFLDAQYDRAARGVTRNYREAVAPGIAARMSNAGRTGSNATATAFDQSQDNLGRTLGEMGTDIYGRAYADERGRQMQAAALAPSMAQADYQDAQALAGVGGAREDLEQAGITEDINRFNFAQNEPWDRLGRYSAFVQGGNYGGETTQPVFRNRASSALGGALGGAAIGARFPGQYGGAIGAGVGGLLGLFGNG